MTARGLKFAAVAFGFASLLGLSGAGAQTEDARQQARASAQRGLDAFDAGRFDQALTLLRQAEDRFHAPVHLLFMARSLEKLGHLVEAREAYVKLVDEPLPDTAPQMARDFQRDARSELKALEPRIPRVVFELVGAKPGVEVTHNGQPVRDLSGPLFVNPGQHEFRATANGLESELQTVTAVEGGQQPVKLELQPTGLFARPTMRLRLTPMVEGLEVAQAELTGSVISEFSMKLEGAALAPNALAELQDGSNTLKVTRPIENSERWVRQRMNVADKMLAPVIAGDGEFTYQLEGTKGAKQLDVNVQVLAGYKQSPFRTPLIVAGSAAIGIGVGVALYLWWGPYIHEVNEQDRVFKQLVACRERKQGCPEDEELMASGIGSVHRAESYRTQALVSGLVGGGVGLGLIAVGIFALQNGDDVPNGWQLAKASSSFQFGLSPQIGYQSAGITARGAW